MSESKASRLRVLLHQVVYDAVATRALEYPEDAVVMKRHAINLRNDIAYRITCDEYRMKQLSNIMAWKKGSRS